MEAGIEYLFWVCFFALILITLVIVTLGEMYSDRRDVLPAPRMDRIARGGKDHWKVSESWVVKGDYK